MNSLPLAARLKGAGGVLAAYAGLLATHLVLDAVDVSGPIDLVRVFAPVATLGLVSAAARGVASVATPVATAVRWCAVAIAGLAVSVAGVEFGAGLVGLVAILGVYGFYALWWFSPGAVAIAWLLRPWSNA